MSDARMVEAAAHVLYRAVEAMEGRFPADDGRMLPGGHYLGQGAVLAVIRELGVRRDA